ncbi:hypothetical protein, partial [Streptococcus pneumoniae]|uniref:hypothetical protein n=1 Tax=Streptococcus pneumoniae TaxID=1313 RepID=UPI0018B06A0B
TVTEKDVTEVFGAEQSLSVEEAITKRDPSKLDSTTAKDKYNLERLRMFLSELRGIDNVSVQLEDGS